VESLASSESSLAVNFGRRSSRRRDSLSRGEGEGLGCFGLRPRLRAGLAQAWSGVRGGEGARPPASLGRTKKVKERNFLFYFLKN
jgi:hypothetical protein